MCSNTQLPGQMARTFSVEKNAIKKFSRSSYILLGIKKNIIQNRSLQPEALLHLLYLSIGFKEKRWRFAK